MFKESIFNSNVFKENSIYKKGVLTEEASEKDKFSYEITALKLIKAAIFFFKKKKKRIREEITPKCLFLAAVIFNNKHQ